MDKEASICNRVKELRARLGLRQADLARETGVTRQTIIAIEKGRLNPSVLIALKLARVLREPVDYIFYLGTADAAGRERRDPARAGTRPAALGPRPVPIVESTRPESFTSLGAADGAGADEGPLPGQAIWDFG